MHRRLCLALSTGIAALWTAGVAPGVRAQSPAPAAAAPQVVLMIGDGMGIAVVTAARIHRGFQTGAKPPAAGKLSVDAAPRSALVHTWALDCMVTDSAAGATALATGHKTVNHALSAAARPDGGLDTLLTLLEIAERRGLSTGLVTTTTLTHATPAAFYAHTLDRSNEAAIALALVPGSGNPRLGNGIEVLLGGGKAFWIPEASGSGRRTDGRNLVTEFRHAGYVIVQDRESMRRAVEGKATRIAGAMSSSHMAYAADRPQAAPKEPSLVEMTRAAIEILRSNPKGFFLMVEGGRIDHALHYNYGYRAVIDMLEFDAAVGEARGMLGDEAVILITADHDHTLVISGNPASEADVFSQAGLDKNGKPFTTLVFANGPSAAAAVPDSLTPQLLHNPDFQERSGIPLDYEDHGGMDVPLYAFGPDRYLSRIRGSMDNTEVFEVLRAAIEGR